MKLVVHTLPAWSRGYEPPMVRLGDPARMFRYRLVCPGELVRRHVRSVGLVVQSDPDTVTVLWSDD